MKLTEHLTSSSSLRSAKSESELSSSHSLTAHFSLAEFERSATASRLGIDNTIPAALIPSLKNLCVNVLEPLREHVGELLADGSPKHSPYLFVPWRIVWDDMGCSGLYLGAILWGSILWGYPLGAHLIPDGTRAERGCR